MVFERRQIVALILTIFAQLLFSTGGLGVRLLDEEPWTILFWRSVFMSTALLFWLFVRHRGKFISEISNTIRKGKYVSLFIAFSLSFYVFSITRTTVADSLLIQGTAPIFIVIFGWIILKERIKTISVLALVGVVVGISIIFIPSLRNGGLSGNFFGMGKALAFAAGTIAIRKQKGVNLIPSLFVAALLTMAVSAPFVENFSLSGRSLLIFMYLGIVQLGGGFILFVSWSGELPTAETGLIVILEAILGPLWVWLFLGEIPNVFTFAGGGVIIGLLITHTLVYYGKSENKA